MPKVYPIATFLLKPEVVKSPDRMTAAIQYIEDNFEVIRYIDAKNGPYVVVKEKDVKGTKK